MAICGSLALLYAESIPESQSLFAGVPQGDDEARRSAKSVLVLAGRVLVVFMFLTVLPFEATPLRLLELLLASVLMTLVMIGYKTKVSALLLVLCLSAVNFYLNQWWIMSSEGWRRRDFVKFRFFQSLSVVGGLLQIVLIGPGHVSMDEYKKTL